jgi:hypothetical protein
MAVSNTGCLVLVCFVAATLVSSLLKQSDQIGQFWGDFFRRFLVDFFGRFLVDFSDFLGRLYIEIF